MATVPDITIRVSVDASPALAGVAFARLETWRLADPLQRSVDVVTFPAVEEEPVLVRLYPVNDGPAIAYTGHGSTLWEAADEALRLATEDGAS